MKKDHYSDYMPEPAYVYFHGNKPDNYDFVVAENTFCIWTGYFSDLYEALFHTVGWENLPVEFEEYHCARDYEDNEGHDYIKINASDTISKLKSLIDNNTKFRLKESTDECLHDFILRITPRTSILYFV